MSLKLLKQSVNIVETNESCDNKKPSLSKRKKSSMNRDTQMKKQQRQNLQQVKSELISKDKKSEENIKRLLALSMNTINVKDAEKIVQRAHKGRYVNKVIPKVEQESIFTEEDFRKFEEEYFNT